MIVILISTPVHYKRYLIESAYFVIIHLESSSSRAISEQFQRINTLSDSQTIVPERERKFSLSTPAPSQTAISAKILTSTTRPRTSIMCHQQSGTYIAADRQPADTWYCSYCGGLNSNWYDVCPVDGQGTKATAPEASLVYAVSYTTYGGAGSPAPGAWYCPNCSAANSSNTPDFCPVCGWRPQA